MRKDVRESRPACRAGGGRRRWERLDPEPFENHLRAAANRPGSFRYEQNERQCAKVYRASATRVEPRILRPLQSLTGLQGIFIGINPAIRQS